MKWFNAIYVIKVHYILVFGILLCWEVVINPAGMSSVLLYDSLAVEISWQ